MSKKHLQSDRITIKPPVIFAFAVLYLAVVYFTCGIWFETNDDVFLSELFSGKLTGFPEFRCLYVSSLITVPLTFLYRIFPAVPWWGILLLLCLVLFIYSLSSLLIANERISFSLLCKLLLLGATLVAGTYIFGQAQFTSSSMLLALSGYFFLLRKDKTRKDYFLFALFEILACSVRDTSMMLAQPVAFAFWFGEELKQFLSKDVRDKKAFLTTAGTAFTIVIAAVGLNLGLAGLTFSGADWKEYKSFNETRVLLTDYSEPLSYSEVDDVLARHGISETEFNNLGQNRFWYPNEKYTAAFREEITPRLKELRSRDSSGTQLLAGVMQLLYYSSGFWNLHRVILCLFILCALAALPAKQYMTFIPLLCGFMGYLAEITVLAYRNRFVFRVMVPFYYGTVVFLVLIAGSVLSPVLSRLIKKENRPSFASVITFLLAFACGIGILGLLLSNGKTQYSYVKRQNALVNNIELTSAKETIRYCEQHPENHYVLDLDYMRFVSTDVLETDYYRKKNYLISGSWFATAPTMSVHGSDYLSTDNLYFIVYETQQFTGLEGLEYYAAMRGTEPELAEKQVLSTGTTIWVYRI